MSEPRWVLATIHHRKDAGPYSRTLQEILMLTFATASDRESAVQRAFAEVQERFPDGQGYYLNHWEITPVPGAPPPAAPPPTPPEQVAARDAAIAYLRGMCAPGTAGALLLHALDAVTAERDGLAREVAHLRERLAHRATLTLEPDDYAGIARLSQ